VHLTLSWEGASTDNPALRLKIQREIAKVLAIAETRVVIAFCGMGVIHVAIRGDGVRSSYQLGFLLKSQTDSKMSSLRQGLLKECSMYLGLELIQNYVNLSDGGTTEHGEQVTSEPAPMEGQTTTRKKLLA